MDPFKKIVAFLAVVLFCLGTVMPGVADASYMPLSSPSFVVMDPDCQQILYSRSAHTRRAPASTTKLLSAMVILDHLDPDQVIHVSPVATYVQPSKIRIAPGEQFYVRDLIKAMLLCSANDAAYALAIATGGTVPGFARMMNVKARMVGAGNSRFVSPAGLPASGQYSTAHDLAKIMAAAERYPLIVETMKLRYGVIYSLNGRKFYLKNTNKMLWASQEREVIGKTGYTRMAKHCFAGRVRVGGKKMFVGLMGAPRRVSLWYDLKRIAAFPSSAMKKTVESPILVNRRLHSRKEVKKIQSALKKAGSFKGPVNGNFGPMTLDAVKRFQRANGLSPDGIVQNQTWKKLKRYL
jgi:D-alanyl-D-alanine carboxypeptidase (penicillin-binding protein 5/6)